MKLRHFLCRIGLHQGESLGWYSIFNVLYAEKFRCIHCHKEYFRNQWADI